MTALLTIEHLSKLFPGQVALDDVDLVVDAGTTHALVGENGSGKSTLIKILAGYHQPTGESSAVVRTANVEHALRLGDAKAADAAGIRFVHQDLGLVDGLTAVENIALGNGFHTKLGRIDWRGEARRARLELADLGFHNIAVTAPVGRLAPSEKTAVALARALRNWEAGASLLVLDEPTAALPLADVERLFDAIRRVKARGVAILYVSHHLDEVFDIADVVTVLRDGKRVATMPIGELNHGKLIELMIGHKLVRSGATAQGESERTTPPRLRARRLAGGTLVNVDIEIRAGEVVGAVGITGSGREHLIPLLIGEMPWTEGEVLIDETRVGAFNPQGFIDAGGAFVTADRARLGNLSLMSVLANTTIADVGRNASKGRLIHKRERQETDEWIGRLGTKAAGRAAPMASLSGGNQQKVLFARGLRLEPSVLVLDEPTRGIDVGAKEEIHTIIDSAATRGGAVLVASSDTDEVIRLAHRVLVFRRGVIAAELVGEAITAHNIEHAQLAAETTTTPTSAEAAGDGSTS